MKTSPKVLVKGVFDCFHAGHLHFLNKAAEYGELIVGVRPDVFCKKYKYPTIFNQYERLELVSSVYEAYLDGNVDWTESIIRFEPNYICRGLEQMRHLYYPMKGLDKDTLQAWGISLIYIPYFEGISTTIIYDRITKAVSNRQDR